MKVGKPVLSFAIFEWQQSDTETDKSNDLA